MSMDHTNFQRVSPTQHDQANREEIIPKFIHLLERKRPLILHGNGENTRRYLYAADAADAFDTILHKGLPGNIYNVGSVDELSNLELCTKILRVYGIAEDKIPNWIRYSRDRPFNDRRYAVDGTKLGLLGWKQRTSFKDGLQATIKWYQQFPNWWGDVECVLTAPTTHCQTSDLQRVSDQNGAAVKEARGVKRKFQDDLIQL
jgi:dTDP-D-glucose 4,6-dehydratase